LVIFVPCHEDLLFPGFFGLGLMVGVGE
jgi:hypothetical protein